METVRTSPRMWFRVYVALAVASVSIACLSIWLGSELITAHRSSVHLHEQWGSRLARLADLSSHATTAQRAVSGDFDRQDPGAALEGMRRAVRAFESDAAAWLDDVRMMEDAELSALLSEQMIAARDAVRAMAAQGELLFTALSEGEMREAGRRLAYINRAYAQSREAMDALPPAMRRALTGMLGAQLRTSERQERVQYTVALLVCIVVVVAMWYGQNLRQAMRVAEQEHKAYLEALAERRDAAEAASRAKSEFVANMSHEIRTPMTAMLGYAELLSDPDVEAGERAQYAQTLRQSGEHLLGVLNDILDLSKIEAGGVMILKRPYSVVQILEEVYSLMHPRAVSQGTGLRTDYRFPLPRQVNIDPLRLKQIVLNLVSNAIKFTPQGEVTLRAEVREGDVPRLAISVQDTGIGLDAAQIERLFQPFTQVDGSARRRFAGTGLGLAISHRLATMMAAAIEVEGERGKGSTFTVVLPLTEEEAANTAHTLAEAAGKEAPAPTATVRVSGRVLLAEDGPDNQRLITTFLRRAGAEVEVVTNGWAAVERALEGAGQGKPFDVVLMDMQMPDLDGYGAAQLLRQRGYEGVVLALTANAMSGERERCLSAGCDDFMTKPLERRRFLEFCSRWMQLRRHAA